MLLVDPHGVAVTHDNVLGVLSLIFWSLNFVVSFKYISIVLRRRRPGRGRHPRPARADGTVAGSAKGIGFIMGVGLFGAALLYGDGIITPAISVLGAVRGARDAHAGVAGVVWCRSRW
jgi:KUP system potassium uptake protein